MTLDSELEKLEFQFANLEEDTKLNVLKYQYAWQDWQMQSVFQSEHEDALKNGYSRYPIGWDENQNINLGEEEIWASNPFMIVISEWIKEVPLYRFESIGQYLIFMKSIYFGINDIAIKVLEKSNSLEKQTLLELDPKATSFTLKGWDFLYPYFVYKGFKVLDMKRLNEDPYSII